MASVSVYLSFHGETEAAFEFYRSVFGGEFQWFTRMADVPPSANLGALTEAQKKLIMHMELPILGGTVLSGSDESVLRGEKPVIGSNMHITLEPDSREQADMLFQKLSAGGEGFMPMHDAFWGAYFGHLHDRFGVSWMIHYMQLPQS